MNKQGKNGIPYCDYTWNPVVGCYHSCSYCFARKIAERFGTKSCENGNCAVCGDCNLEPSFDCKRYIPTERTHHLEWPVRSFAKRTKDGGGIKEPFPYGFEPTFHDGRLAEPFKIKKPSRIFVSDMGDLFGDWVPRSWVDTVLNVVKECPQHTFLFLTKNPKRYREFEFPENAWIGTSVENQATADERIPLLLQTPAVVRFISAEPLLGAVDLIPYLWEGRYPQNDLIAGSPRKLDWVITGGESGPGARPMHPDWVRSLRDQCQAAGTKFFFKSWGDWLPNAQEYDCNPGGVDYEQKHELVGNVAMCRVGKNKSGRLIDSRTWDEMPEIGGQ
jgi:protein gp37